MDKQILDEYQKILLDEYKQLLSIDNVENGYELIAGERRLRAAIRAGLTEIPCIIMRMTEQESATTALVENLHSTPYRSLIVTIIL